ncbi:MAG: DUF1801 domain-containing protein [bacterium]
MAVKAKAAGKVGLSKEERDAMKETMRERARQAAGEDGEAAVMAAIKAMAPADRGLAERLHKLVRSTAPGLTCRTWYGMPAYADGDRVVVFFKAAQKFKERYATLGFNQHAKLDDGRMWPTSFGLTGIGPAEEKAIVALVKKAAGA